MGTDIFMYAERRTPDGWVLCEPMVSDSKYESFEASGEAAFQPQSLYDTRNYALFAILADVRNPTHSDERYEPIAPRRGLPDDVSTELGAWDASWGSDAFGHTWYLLSELQAYPWHKRKIIKCAMVEASVARLFGDGQGSFPLKQWPADERVSYSAYLRGGVEVTWIETYAESAGREFLEDTFRRLASYGRPDEVRIVLWFS